MRKRMGKWRSGEVGNFSLFSILPTFQSSNFPINYSFRAKMPIVDCRSHSSGGSREPAAGNFRMILKTKMKTSAFSISAKKLTKRSTFRFNLYHKQGGKWKNRKRQAGNMMQGTWTIGRSHLPLAPSASECLPGRTIWNGVIYQQFLAGSDEEKGKLESGTYLSHDPGWGFTN
jgi:hypothetical protein